MRISYIRRREGAKGYGFFENIFRGNFEHTDKAGLKRRLIRAHKYNFIVSREKCAKTFDNFGANEYYVYVSKDSKWTLSVSVALAEDELNTLLVSCVIPSLEWHF